MLEVKLDGAFVCDHDFQGSIQSILLYRQVKPSFTKLPAAVASQISIGLFQLESLRLRTNCVKKSSLTVFMENFWWMYRAISNGREVMHRWIRLRRLKADRGSPNKTCGSRDCLSY